MKIYIDCDGVILTEEGLFNEYRRLKENGEEMKRLEYLQKLDWRYWLEHAKPIF